MKSIKLDMRPDLNGVMHEISMRIKNETNIYPKKHTHSFWEFIFVESGSIFQSVNGIEKIAQKNELYIIHPESEHLLKQNGSEPVILINFEVSVPFLTQLVQSIGFSSIQQVFNDCVFCFSCSNEEALSYIRLLNKSQEELADYEQKWTLLKVLVNKFVIKAIDNLYTLPKYTNTNQIIALALAELDNTNNFRLTIDQLFKRLNYSHEHISRLFQKEGLETPVKIFLKNKLSYSRTLLISSNMKIISIANICGINSTSYYNKAFKKEYGLTPTEYRKKFNIEY